MTTPAAGSAERSEGLPATLHDKAGLEYLARLYEASDREALERFYDEFEPKRCAQGLPPKGADRVAKWLDGILVEGSHLVLILADELVGHAMLMPTGREDSEEYAVFLRRDLRGRGLGTELNRLALDIARARGIRRVWLSVEPHNRAAIRSYEKVGFTFLPGTMYAPEAEMEILVDEH